MLRIDGGKLLNSAREKERGKNIANSSQSARRHWFEHWLAFMAFCEEKQQHSRNPDFAF